MHIKTRQHICMRMYSGAAALEKKQKEEEDKKKKILMDGRASIKARAAMWENK